MCLEKSHPNYFRCDWKNYTPNQLADHMVAEAKTLEATMPLKGIEPDLIEAYDAVLDQLENQLAAAIGKLSTKDVDDVRKSLRQHGKRKLGKGHLVCAVSAEIGEACHTITSIPASLAKAVGKAVAKKTESKVLGKVSELAVQKWMASLTATSSLGQLKQVGCIADTIAVCTCPGQQADGNPETHPEVVVCEGRLRGKVVQDKVKAILKKNLPR